MPLTEDLQRQVREALATTELERLTDVCLKFAQPAWAIIPTSVPQTGATRLGGSPDLPPGVEWPTDPDGARGNFFGQLDLTSLPSEAGFGRGGLLSLFTTRLESAAEPVVVDAILTPPGNHLEPVEASEVDEDYANPNAGYLTPVGVGFEPIVSLPLTQKDFVAAIRASTDNVDDRETLIELFEERTGDSIGQLGGFGNPHSGDDFRRTLYFHRHGHPNAQWCDDFDSREDYLAYAARGERAGPLRYGEEYDWIFGTADAIASEAARWRLLLRIDSNHAMGLSLMDWDPIYFYAPVDEITSGRIEHVEAMVTQG